LLLNKQKNAVYTVLTDLKGKTPLASWKKKEEKNQSEKKTNLFQQN
jgi:hypothetical protein